MQCPQCRAENRKGRRFCAMCGEVLTFPCSFCNFVNESQEKFCGGCGRSLTDLAWEKASDLSPEAYTPRHIATKILTSRHALEGEHKQVTVLFCDLVESTQLAEQVAAEVMHQIMDRILKLMAEGVHRYGGTVNQFLGDGVMALFGAPLALEDHALRGVQAALTIQETLSGYGVQLRQEHGVDLRLRMGLNTGPVVVGRIGDDLRMDYTAVGDTTNLAARLQAMAEPGTILIAEATHRRVEGHVRTESLGLVRVKGRSQSASVFKVTGRRRRRTHLEIRAERGLTPLVGRERELALLRECWERAKQGRGQTVGILGEPGVGKSRLLFEFRRTLAGERMVWLEGHCSAMGQASPYLPIMDLLRARLQIEEGDNPLQMKDKLRQGVRQLDEGLEQSIPVLEEMFNLLSGDKTLRHTDPQMKRRLTFDALHALTAAAARTTPLVLLVEDLHWVDKTSEDYLAFLAQSMDNMSVLLLTSHRPGYVVKWAEQTSYTQLALALFSEHEAELMIAKLLGSQKVPPELARRILEKAEANPLALEEITASLIERGIFVRGESGLREAASSEVSFPATIQDIVRARIDRLDESVKDTLQIAAAIGREFNTTLLERVSQTPAELGRHLNTLKQLELIHDTPFFPEPVSAFKHAVIQDVAYQGLLLQRRQELHVAIGQAIEELYADHVDDHAAILAHHYRLSERHGKVLRYALIVGDKAARLYGRAEAKEYYEQALTAAQTLPESPEARRAEIDVILKLATVGVTRSDTDRDLAALERARALADALGDERRLAQVLYWLGRIHYVVGTTSTAIAYAEQGLAIADRLGDEALAAAPVNLLGRAYSRSTLPRAVQMMVRSVEQMHRVGNTTEETTARGFTGGLLAVSGDFEPAFTYLEQGIQLAREAGNPFAEAANYFYRGIAHEQHGAPARAVPDYEAALRLAESAGDIFRIYATKHYEGWACTMAGDVPRGRELLEESLALATRLGTKVSLGLAKAYFAGSLMAEGRYDEAVSICAEAIKLAEETQEISAGAVARRILAEVLLYRHPPDPQLAERTIAEATRIQQEIGAKPELARSFLTYARVRAALGESAQSKACLTEAIAMFQQMDMAWDIAQTEQWLRTK
jgi:class 3 adenylate cyclase/tetratricopeptide (TPR) repeat protein